MSKTHSYNIKYKKFTELMADISDDLSSLSEERYIQSDKFIKVAQTCNSFLSTKINPLKEDVITIKNKKGRLPSNFKLLDSALMCTSYLVYAEGLKMPEVHYEFVPKHKLCDVKASCSILSQVTDNKGIMSFLVYKTATGSWHNIKQTSRLRIKTKSFCSEGCVTSLNEMSEISIVKEKDTFYLQTNFEEGEVYITYVAEMEDDDGDLIILDHPLTNEYYEYAIKTRIYEDIWLNGLEEVQNKLQYVNEKYRIAKISASSFVKMFDFSELKEVYFDNRKIAKMKYDNIIQ